MSKVFDGKKVAELLQQRRLTISDLAKGINSSRPVVSQWLSGRRNPKRPAIQNIADFLRVNISDISSLSDLDTADLLLQEDCDCNSEEKNQRYIDYTYAELQRQVKISGQHAIAQKLGLSQSHVGNLVNGEAKIADLKLSAFLRLFPSIEIKFNSETQKSSADLLECGHAALELLNEQQIKVIVPLLELMAERK